MSKNNNCINISSSQILDQFLRWFAHLAAIGGGAGVLPGDIVDLHDLSRGSSHAPALPRHTDELNLPWWGSWTHRPINTNI
jgi:hypothetical protein